MPLSSFLYTKRFNWNRWTVTIALGILAVWGISSSWEYNSKYPRSHWQSDLRADAAGYYVYLPGVFHWGFQAEHVPDSLVEIAGHGFSLNRDNNRIITKYFYGCAVLQAPFYLIAEAVTGWGATDGFDPVHHRAIEAAGIFYWLLGLLFIGLALHHEFRARPWVAAVVLLAISFGTNVFYYAFRSPAYSHIYSFLLVSVALWAMITGPAFGKQGWKLWLFHGSCAFIVWIRPIDVLAVAALYAWLFHLRREAFMNVKFWLAAGSMMLVAAAPQFFYWHYVHGHWLFYSYGDEGFSNWNKPDLIRELFSPMNGLVPHAPAMLFFPLGVWTLWRTRRFLGIVVLGVFALGVYACAAWHSWEFGCSYGLRPMVQYMPFLAVALWSFLSHPGLRAYSWRCAVLPLLVLLSFVNYRIMLEYSGCYAWGEWNWSEYVIDITDAFFGHLGPDKK